MESNGDEAVTQHPKRSKDSVLPMPNLPEELITQILLRLPVESLLQFRCVSKSWLSLISSPQFVKSHMLVSSSSNEDYTHYRVMFKVSNAFDVVRDCSVRALVYNSVTKITELYFPGKKHGNYPRLVGSVNGLICIAIWVSRGLYDLFLWNPSIKKYKKLPSYSLNLSRHDRDDHRSPFSFSFAYDEFQDDYSFGFAYDEFQDDYKVVGIFPIRGHVRLDHHAKVKIYSLKNDLWRCIGNFEGQGLSGGSAKFYNGKLHWFDDQWNVISIDLADEKWGKIARPSYFEGCKHLELGVFEGDLSVFCNYPWTHADVWVMKEYGVKESWTKMFTIKYPEYSYCTGLVFYSPILMSNEGEILLQFGSRLTKYNPKDDSVTYLNVTKLASRSEVQIYVKSLVCPFYWKSPRMHQRRRFE